MLEAAVAELRGEPIHREIDPELRSRRPGFIPDDYVPDPGQRLELYKRLRGARRGRRARRCWPRSTDRYGPLPGEVILLGELMGVKTIARALGVLAYELAPTRIVLSFAPDAALDPTKVTKLVSTRGSRFKLTPDMRLAYNFDDREKLDRMPAARARLEQLKNLVAG